LPCEDKRRIKFLDVLKNEKPYLIENDRIGFYQYQKNIGRNYAGGENATPDYGFYLDNGFDYVYNYLCEKEKDATDNQKSFIKSAKLSIDAVYDYVKKLKKISTGDLKKALENVPQNRPRSYHEALVMVKCIIFSLRCNKNNHITLGRFDQYMYPFFKMDLENGKTYDELLELTEEFFLSINFDTDLYFGIQKGDNGQSLVLGGLNVDKTDSFNELSKICMQASMELNLIDPKINLRVNKNTPFELYLLGTQMTKLGLGFPQYSNDDVVIDALIEMGYEKEDAYNYSVAACWEFITNNGDDTPNIAIFNFPSVINNTFFEKIDKAETFDEFMKFVKENIKKECDAIHKKLIEKVTRPNADAFYSLFIKSCVEKCLDFTHNSAKYNNFGVHGVGIANGADALCAIKKVIFDEKSVTKEELKNALNANFEGYEKLRNKLLNCPKMGNDDDEVDLIACEIMEEYANGFKNKKNQHGGIIRAGTGSAHAYITGSRDLGATADGRYAFTPLPSSFSPSLTAKTQGPLSVIKSFTKFDLKKVMNGGPLTIEIHDNTFRNEMGIEKVALLVKSFIELGGHQLQLNSINREKLIEAQLNPELHKNLIVRVWGWSGYFNELEKKYQDHIISRTEYMM